MTQCVCACTHSSNFGAVTLSKTFLDHSSICICSRYFFLNMVPIIPFPATKSCQADRSPLHSLFHLPGTHCLCMTHCCSFLRLCSNITFPMRQTLHWPPITTLLPSFGLWSQSLYPALLFHGNFLHFIHLFICLPVHTIIIYLSSIECRLHDGRNFFHWCLHRAEKKVAEKIPVAYYFLD